MDRIEEKRKNLYTLLEQKSKGNFFLSENLASVEKIVNFIFDERTDFCLVKSKSGCFKTEIINFVLDSIPQEKTLVFRFKFFEASSVDDIFLSFFNDLKRFYRQGLISVPKIESHSLVQKISNFFSHTSKKVIIFFDSLENITDGQNILNFLQYLSRLNNIKIIAASSGDITPDVNFSTIEIEPFSIEQIQKMFDFEEIGYTEKDIEGLYEETGGEMSFVFYIASIAKTLNISLDKIHSEYKSKNLGFKNFILQKLTSLVPDKYKKTLQILALINTGLSEEFLLGNNLITKEQLSYFIEKRIISKENGFLFLKPELKNYVYNVTPHFDKIKLHKFLLDFYNAELPKKPAKRVLPVSRATMRNQIAYHGSSLPPEMPKNKQDINASLLTYMSGNTDWKINRSLAADKKSRPVRERKRPELRKPESVESKYKLTKEELALLGVPVDLNKEGANRGTAFVAAAPVRVETADINKLLQTAKTLEEEHDYVEAYRKYLEAYDEKNAADYEKYQKDILNGLIFNALKNDNSDSAVLYSNKLIEYYREKNDVENANIALLSLGKIYKDSYKYTPARRIYEGFLNNPGDCSKSIVGYSLIALAEIEEDSANLEKSVLYYQKAFQMASTIDNPAFLAEAYFKYALILDDNAQIEMAKKYYLKCTEIKEKNPYLSSAYTNIAEIFKETGQIKECAQNYNNALKIDLENQNYDGIYYICTNLAEIFRKRDLEKSLNYSLKALSAAKRLNEDFYIISSYEKAAECYFGMQNYEKALKALLFAEKIITVKDIKYENIDTIEKRIKELKMLLEDDVVEKITESTNAV